MTRKRTGESVTEAITTRCPMCEGRGRIASAETVTMWIEREMRRRLSEEGDAYLVECHPAVVECLIGADGAAIEELEHELRRGILVRANFDFDFEDFEIESGSLDELERTKMGLRRAQVLECNVRRSLLEGSEKAVGWTDGGYYVELVDGADYISQRIKVVLRDIRRAFAVADVIIPGRN
jgi:ribonuclease G